MFNPVYNKMKNKPEGVYGDSAYNTYEVRDRLGGWFQATYL